MTPETSSKPEVLRRFDKAKKSLLKLALKVWEHRHPEDILDQVQKITTKGVRQYLRTSIIPSIFIPEIETKEAIFNVYEKILPPELESMTMYVFDQFDQKSGLDIVPRFAYAAVLEDANVGVHGDRNNTPVHEIACMRATMYMNGNNRSTINGVYFADGDYDKLTDAYLETSTSAGAVVLHIDGSVNTISKKQTVDVFEEIDSGNIDPNVSAIIPTTLVLETKRKQTKRSNSQLPAKYIDHRLDMFGQPRNIKFNGIGTVMFKDGLNKVIVFSSEDNGHKIDHLFAMLNSLCMHLDADAISIGLTEQFDGQPYLRIQEYWDNQYVNWRSALIKSDRPVFSVTSSNSHINN